MKKLLSIFTTSRRNNENFYSFCDNALPDSSKSESSTINAYKFYHFDSPCSGGGQTTFDEVQLFAEKKPFSCSLGSLLQDSPSTSGKYLLEKEEGQYQNSNSKSVLTDHFDINLAASILLSPEESKSQIKSYSGVNERLKKSAQNGFVICINNSTKFHVGQQTTINVNKSLEKTDVIREYTQKDLNALLDSEEKLTEDKIALISLNLDHQWKEILKNLGIEESTLEEFVCRNDNNKGVIIYDALQKFVTLFPNTTVGFVVNVLIEYRQFTIIEIFSREINALF